LLLINKEEIYDLLIRYHSKLDLAEEEFLVVSAYVAHSGYYQKTIYLEEMASIANMEQDEIKAIITRLFDKNFLNVIDNKIDNQHLYRTLKRIEYNHMSLVEKLVKSYSDYCKLGDSIKFYGYMGQIEVVAHENGGIMVFDENGFLWSKKDMLELAKGIKQFAEATDQDDLDKYNETTLKQMEYEKGMEEMKRKQREEKLEEKRQRPPKSGFIFLIRLYPGGNYRFTYTMELSKELKTLQIKEEYKNLVEIIHVFDVYDTLKFYHKFLKKQFTNRLVEGTKNEYKLTEKDIEYLRTERFPGNAMDWLVGFRESSAS